MSEDSEVFKALRSKSREKRWRNYTSSLYLLQEAKVSFEVLDEATAHVRVGEYDFWPTTGFFIHRESGKKGRGVRNLIAATKHNH